MKKIIYSALAFAVIMSCSSDKDFQTPQGVKDSGGEMSWLPPTDVLLTKNGPGGIPPGPPGHCYSGTTCLPSYVVQTVWAGNQNAISSAKTRYPNGQCLGKSFQEPSYDCRCDRISGPGGKPVHYYKTHGCGLWVSENDGWYVYRFDSQGRFIEKIEELYGLPGVPNPNPGNQHHPGTGWFGYWDGGILGAVGQG